MGHSTNRDCVVNVHAELLDLTDTEGRRGSSRSISLNFRMFEYEMRF